MWDPAVVPVIFRLVPVISHWGHSATNFPGMQACTQGAQISGLGPLRQLVQPGCWYAAAAAAAAAQHVQPLRRCPPCAAASFATATSTASSTASSSKPLFSSRAKIAEACVPWLKGSRNRWVLGWRVASSWHHQGCNQINNRANNIIRVL